MELVTLIVVLNHLPCDVQLSFMPNGHVADVKTPFVCFFFFFLAVQVYLYSSVSLSDQPFSIYLRFKLVHLLPC